MANGNLFETQKCEWIEDGVLLARDGIIEEIGPRKTVALPPEAETIDADVDTLSQF